jgi:hypothetical protein
MSLTRKCFLSFLPLFSLSIHLSTILRRVFLIYSTAFPSHLPVYCSMLCVSLLPPKFFIYIHFLTILFLCIFHFSPTLNFNLSAYRLFSRVSHFFRYFPFSCTCQFLLTYLVLIPFPPTCVIFSFVLDALCFGFQKLKSFGLPQTQVFNRARYLQVPNISPSCCERQCITAGRQTDDGQPVSCS